MLLKKVLLLYSQRERKYSVIINEDIKGQRLFRRILKMPFS
jgi:hypothetical protein